MANGQAVNQNVSFYPTDLAIVEAVKQRNGQTLSGAVRFIIREWARASGLQSALDQPAQSIPASRSIKSSSRKRAAARKNAAHSDEIRDIIHEMKTA
jgi:hypothetical protein